MNAIYRLVISTIVAFGTGYGVAYAINKDNVNHSVQNVKSFLESKGCVTLGPPKTDESKKHFVGGYMCDELLVVIPKL